MNPVPFGTGFILCLASPGFSFFLERKVATSPVGRCPATGLRCHDRRSWARPTGAQDPSRQARRKELLFRDTTPAKARPPAARVEASLCSAPLRFFAKPDREEIRTQVARPGGSAFPRPGPPAAGGKEKEPSRGTALFCSMQSVPYSFFTPKVVVSPLMSHWAV